MFSRHCVRKFPKFLQNGGHCSIVKNSYSMQINQFCAVAAIAESPTNTDILTEIENATQKQLQAQEMTQQSQDTTGEDPSDLLDKLLMEIDSTTPPTSTSTSSSSTLQNTFSKGVLDGDGSTNINSTAGNINNTNPSAAANMKTDTFSYFPQALKNDATNNGNNPFNATLNTYMISRFNNLRDIQEVIPTYLSSDNENRALNASLILRRAAEFQEYGFCSDLFNQMRSTNDITQPSYHTMFRLWQSGQYLRWFCDNRSNYNKSMTQATSRQQLEWESKKLIIENYYQCLIEMESKTFDFNDNAAAATSTKTVSKNQLQTKQEPNVMDYLLFYNLCYKFKLHGRALMYAETLTNHILDRGIKLLKLNSNSNSNEEETDKSEENNDTNLSKAESRDFVNEMTRRREMKWIKSIVSDRRLWMAMMNAFATGSFYQFNRLENQVGSVNFCRHEANLSSESIIDENGQNAWLNSAMQKALYVYQQLREKFWTSDDLIKLGLTPHNQWYINMLNGFSNSFPVVDVNNSEMIFRDYMLDIKRFGMAVDIRVVNAMIDIYARIGDIYSCLEVYRMITQIENIPPNGVTFRILLKAFINNGNNIQFGDANTSVEMVNGDKDVTDVSEITVNGVEAKNEDKDNNENENEKENEIEDESEAAIESDSDTNEMERELSENESNCWYLVDWVLNEMKKYDIEREGRTYNLLFQMCGCCLDKPDWYRCVQFYKEWKNIVEIHGSQVDNLDVNNNGDDDNDIMKNGNNKKKNKNDNMIDDTNEVNDGGENEVEKNMYGAHLYSMLCTGSKYCKVNNISQENSKLIFAWVIQEMYNYNFEPVGPMLKLLTQHGFTVDQLRDVDIILDIDQIGDITQ